MARKTLNTNSFVWIKLTPFGIKLLKKEHEELRLMVPSLGKFVPPKTDENGYSKMQLWQVMNTFGKYLCIVAEPDEMPFAIEIQIDDAAFKE